MRKPTLEQAKELIVLARAAINGGDLPETSYDGEAGVFVTLSKDGGLRGCVGVTDLVSVRDGVIDSAKSAAFRDPRFPPVRGEELRLISVEISLLSKPEPCSLQDIGRGDGVIIRKGFRSALFLPQVWDEFSFKDGFLDALAFKAGLDDYHDAVFEKFSVIAFMEKAPEGEVGFNN